MTPNADKVGYQVWVWHRDDGGGWHRGAIYPTQAEAEQRVRQIERFYGTAADWERVEASPIDRSGTST